MSGKELEEVQAMPMQGSLLGTVMSMDAARPYVDGDDTAEDQFFCGYDSTLFVRGGEVSFFPVVVASHACFPGFAS